MRLMNGKIPISRHKTSDSNKLIHVFRQLNLERLKTKTDFSFCFQFSVLYLYRCLGKLSFRQPARPPSPCGLWRDIRFARSGEVSP